MEKTVVSPEIPIASERTAFLAPGSDVTQAAITLTCPVCRTDNPPGDRWCRDCGFLLGSTVAEIVEIPETPAGPRLIDGSGREHALRDGANSVGRENADVLLLDGTVSRAHARLTLEDGAAWVEDLGSTNGTRVGGRTIAAGERAAVSDGDEVRFGSVTLQVALAEGETARRRDGETATTSDPTDPSDRSDLRSPEPAAAVALLVAADGIEHPLRLGRTSAGRRSDNDIVITGDPYVSGRHAAFLCDETSCSVLDLGSTNGTFIRDERLREGQPQALAPGETVRLGQSVFTLQPAAEVAVSDQPSDEEEVSDETMEASNA